jgi:hypothetical protein
LNWESVNYEILKGRKGTVINEILKGFEIFVIPISAKEFFK